MRCIFRTTIANLRDVPIHKQEISVMSSYCNKKSNRMQTWMTVNQGNFIFYFYVKITYLKKTLHFKLD